MTTTKREFQPNTEKYAIDYFIKGSYDDKLTTALALQTNPQNANKLLADAVESTSKISNNRR
jgi:hypothetical protein